ncbi:MAG: sulfurtransferase-like selenium metabolism protein YedF [Desulfobacter sp.]|nr:MAG: sulfurtransferase-like selenium metabolism protein YedF [Desulfobacter sp.]
MNMEIDARGLACPEPVIRTKKGLEEEKSTQVQVVVDNPASQENVRRFLESQGFQTAVEQAGEDYFIMGDRDAVPEFQPGENDTDDQDLKKIAVVCATDRMGYGDDELGKKLMISFIKTLKEMGDELWRLVFVNNGVKLTIGGSPVLEELQAYEKEGLQILVCGTCLTHFGLLEEKQAGETTNMLDIVTAMQLADKVIKI